MVRSPVLTDVLERANEVQKSMKSKGRKKKVKDDAFHNVSIHVHMLPAKAF